MDEDSVDNPYYFFQPFQEQTLTVKSPKLSIDVVQCTKGDRNCNWKAATEFGDGRLSATRTITSVFCGGIAGTITAFIKSNVCFCCSIIY